MEVTVRGRVRRLLESIGPGDAEGDQDFYSITPLLETITAQGAAPYREVVRAGRAFVVNNTTAVASVVALPTTAVNMALYNNEPDGGRSYVIDWVAALNVVAGAATGQSQIIANLGQVRETAPADAALGTTKKLNGLGTGTDTRSRLIIGGTALPTTTGTASAWFPLGSAVGKPGAVAVGPSIWVPVDGRLIVPPGRYFALHTFSDIVTDTFLMYVAWHEIQVPLG